MCDFHEDLTTRNTPYVRAHTHLMKKVRPAAKLMKASASCSQLGSAYGDCILRTYNNIAKDTCAKEFALFKECVSAQTKKR